ACSQTSTPRIGVLPSETGLSWFGVLVISSSPLLTTNQAQPEPKRPAAAASNLLWKSSKLPNVSLILSATEPFASPPPFGDKISQKKLWFKCPPPLLRTAVRISSGTASKFLISSSNDLLSRSLCPSNAAFNFVTYVL